MNHLTIYFTSDTHGYVYPTSFRDKQPQAMGLFCMRFPRDEHTLVIDGGDTIQGSPLTYYCHTHREALPVADVMNRLGYDYCTLGNHDFNYGREWMQSHLSALHARCLCANVVDEYGTLPIEPFAIHTFADGMRVGLIGLVTDWVNRWEQKDNLRGLRVTSPLEAARKAADALRFQNVDVLIGIYHGGLERDTQTRRLLSETDENIACRLCEEVPFDLLLTGHQHIPMVNRHWHGTHLAQPPCNGTQYVRVTMDEQKRFCSELLPSSADPVQKEGDLALRARVEAWLDAPVARFSRPLWPKDKLAMAAEGSAVADFFNRVQLWASGADISCTCLGNELRGFDAQVTVRDVVASYVYSNTLVILEVTGKDLRMALEQCATYFDVGPDGALRVAAAFLEPKEAHYNYDYFAGIDYAFDLTQPVGNRVSRLRKNGLPVHEDDRFTLVMNNYRATGAGGFDFYTACPKVREIQTEVSELILNYLSTHPQVEIPAETPIVRRAAQ